MTQEKKLPTNKLSHFIPGVRTLRYLLACLFVIFCLSANAFAAAEWAGDMGSIAYGDTTEAYMTADTTFDKLTIYCGEQYFTVDLCGYSLSITTLDLGENWKTGQIKFTDSVGGGTVTIGTIDATNTTMCGYKYIYVDEGVTVTLTTNYNKGNGGNFDIVGDGTLIIADTATGIGNINNIDSSVTVEGDGTNAAYWVSKQYTWAYIWSGAADTDWYNASNWYYDGSVPSEAPGATTDDSNTDKVIIPTLDDVYQPALTNGNLYIYYLQIRSGMTLTSEGNDIVTYENIHLYGSIADTCGVFYINKSDAASEAAVFASGVSASGLMTLNNEITYSGDSTGTFAGSAILMNHDFTSSRSDVIFDSIVQLTDSVTITTTNGNLTFNDAIQPQTAQTQSLTIVAGSGDVTFNGIIGHTGSSSLVMGALTISSANDVTMTSSSSGTERMTDLTISNSGDVNCTNTISSYGAISINCEGDFTSTHSVNTKNADISIVTGGNFSTTSSVNAASEDSTSGSVSLQSDGTIDIGKSITAKGAVTVLSSGTSTIGDDDGDSIVSSASGAITFGSSTYTGSLSIDGNITSSDSAIIFYNDTSLTASATFTSGSADITSKGDFTASSGLTIDAANSIFEGDFACGTGAFTSNSEITRFLGSADFSASTGVTFSNASNNIYIFNEADTANTFSVSSSGFECNYLYIAGNITASLAGTLTADIIYGDIWIDDYTIPSGFTLTFTGSGSITADDVYFGRCAGSTGSSKVSNIEIECDLTSTTSGRGELGTQDGVNLTISSGANVSANSFNHNSLLYSLAATLTIEGNLTVDDFNINGNTGAIKTVLASDGTLTAANVRKSSSETAYQNGSETYAFENEGTIEVSESITFYDNYLYSGSGKIILNGSGAYISNSGSDDVAVGEIQISDTASIGDSSSEGSGALSCTTFTATGLGGKTLTLNRDLTVSGSASTSFVLSGTSESSRLSLVAAAQDNGFIVSKNFTLSSYLSIDSNIVMKDSAGNIAEYTCTTISDTDSVPSAGTDSDDYAAVINNGWIIIDIGYLTFTWVGGASGSENDWNTEANWDLELIPDTESTVKIPDGLSYYPELADGTYVAGNLTVGTASEVSHDATITLTDSNLTISELAGESAVTGITNYGKIIYKAAGRIVDDSTTSLFLNDVSQGSVEYSTGSESITNLGDTDYYDLIISSGSWTSSSEILVAGQLTLSGGSLVLESEMTVTGDAEVTGSVQLSGSLTVNGANALTITSSGVLTTETDDSLEISS
ncbi:MAG: hypothetical protein K5839_03040, partial [Treponemataceae bacterium]|nr:hypothetical protein [Treponemataceae bacterium]